jgi:hypothetical protein
VGHTGGTGSIYMRSYTHGVLEVETTQESWKDSLANLRTHLVALDNLSAGAVTLFKAWIACGTNQLITSVHLVSA